MAIALDASTPVAVDGTNITTATQTTASFSPPANSLVVIAVDIGYFNTTGTGPTVTCADSAAVSYAAGPSNYSTIYSGAYIFSHYYSSAPGAITVTVTRSGALGQAMFEIVPYVLTGAASSQSGAASASAHDVTSTSTFTSSLTTTVTGSWAIVAGSLGGRVTLTVSGLSTDHSYTDNTDTVMGAAGHAVTGTPGATTLGWTGSGNVPGFAWAALEILPASGSASVSLAEAGAGSDSFAVNGAIAQPLAETGTGSDSLSVVLFTAPVTFPTSNLNFKTEILLNGVWTDISNYLYQRKDLTISGHGRPDWTSSIQPAQATLSLNNRDGRFTPKNASGAYYPNLTRNTQLRVSVNSQSTTLVSYSGYRFWGEVSEWPVSWDVSGSDIVVDIQASGIWRRISQLQTSLGSAFTRYNSITLTGSSAPRSYWPMEDGAGSGQLVPFDSVAGTANAIQSFVTGTGGLSLAASTDFKGSDGIPQLNAAKIIATVAAGGTPTNNCTRFLLSVPAAGDSASGTTNWNVIEINSAGTVAKFEVYLNFSGTLLMQLRNSGGAVIASGTTTTNVKGVPVLVSCELTPSGGNVNFALRVITPGAPGITESMTGTLTTATIGAVSTIVFGRAFALNDTAVGQLSETYAAVPSMVNAAKALNGYLGEKAMDRFTRICAEMGITSETIGAASTTAAMGPQFDMKLAEMFQSFEDADCGLLTESRKQFGLCYRALTSMNNQAVAATFSYAAATLSGDGLKPVYDDQMIRNDVTVTNWTGYKQQAILTAGAMSVLNPPSGVGNGYVLDREVSLAADTQVAGVATWLLNLGCVDEVRYPTVTFQLERSELTSLFAVIPALRPGDYFQVTSLPVYAGTATAKQLVWGYTETLNAKTWKFEINAVPESPYETGFSPGTTQIAQIPGSGATTSTAPGAGGLGGVIVNGGITPSMLSKGITIRTLGGNAVTISASAPSAPNVNDIWIASATGLISQWNGSAWAPFKFDGSATIQASTITAAQIAAGTIVAGNIAAGTITAALLAAGIVVAGIVDATTITGATLIADGTSGEILVYSGTPAVGNLIGSWSGAAGSDRPGNDYPLGLMAQALTLQNQGSAPPAVTSASSFYSSTAGRPRYLSQAGADTAIERSDVNVSQFTVGNTVTPGTISATLNYKANESSQSSEFELEIRGNGAGNVTTANTLTFDLYIDGAQYGGGFAIGATFFTNGSPGLPNFRFTVSFLLSIVSSGAGGTAVATSTGTCVNSGNFQGSGGTLALGGIFSGSFDSTANHTLLIKANWGGTATGQTLTTFRTKLGRRM